MNIPEQEIEGFLRLAPAPKPPAGLKDQLLAEIPFSTIRQTSAPATTVRPGSWLRRWWPALAPASISLACAAVFTMQQMEIQELQQTARTLAQAAAPPSAKTEQTNFDAAGQAGAATTEVQEIVRLKETAARLAAEVGQLEQLRTENEKLRAQIAAAAAPHFTPEEEAAMAEVREKNQQIQCANNMKQLGLSLKVWALDNNDTYPPDIILMTNEMSTPKILVCPGDTGRQVAANWSAYSPANCSYEYLAPSGSDTEPNRIAFRCPIHGTVGLCDGSVQAGIAKTHPERIVQRNGKSYLDEPGAQPPRNAPSSPNPIQPSTP